MRDGDLEALAVALDETPMLERTQAFAHRRAVYTELRGEIGLRRQPVARSEPARRDHPLDRIGHLPVRRSDIELAEDGGRGHVEPSLVGAGGGLSFYHTGPGRYNLIVGQYARGQRAGVC